MMDDRDKLVELIQNYAQHDSVRCGWPAGYEQWRFDENGKATECACGLVESLIELGLPVEWAGGPPE